MYAKPAMQPFTSITIIYNPISTGPGKQLARELKAQLAELLPGQEVRLQPTKHAGHGEELAYKLAQASQRPLIISASGDGGYSDTINGLMRAQAKGAHPTAGLLPAGNANDHFNDIHRGDLARNIQKQRLQQIDLLKLSASIGGKPFVRYAHSYIGFGLTPKVGAELNKTSLNVLNEKWVVLRGLFRSKPVKITIGGKRRSYESLVCSNVSKMSKFLVLSKKSSHSDGVFEVTAIRGQSKLRLITSLLRHTTGAAPEPLQTARYAFQTRHTTLVQVDGEVFTLDAYAPVTITIQPHALHCVV